MIIHVYAICWNEERMLPYFFKHYDAVADQYFIFDNGSTDASLAILESRPNVTVDSFGVEGGSLIRTAQVLFNQFWKSSRGRADWIIVCDVDEHLYHPDLRGYLEECASKGITLVVPEGYEMVSDGFPENGLPLAQTIKRGVRSREMDKPQIFRPDAVRETNFGPGRHLASPEGEIIRPSVQEIKLLHYKYLGFEYLNARYSVLQQGLREGDIANRWGYHYLWDEKQKREQFERMKKQTVQVL